MATQPKPPHPPLTEPPSRWKTQGLGPTLLALLVLAAALIIIGAVVWLHKSGPPNVNTPTQPSAPKANPGMALPSPFLLRDPLLAPQSVPKT